MTASPVDHARLRVQLQHLASWLDDRFRLPVIGWRVGLDSLIGLIPALGDVLTAAVSIWIIIQGVRCQVPRRVFIRMAVNIILDLLLGSVPLAGDIFDVFWKANQKNVRLMLKYLPEHDDKQE